MGTTFVEFVHMVSVALWEVGIWAHGTANEKSWKGMVFSWFWHALMVLPGTWLAMHAPWAAGGIFLAYREAEQAFFAHLAGAPQNWVDRVGDFVIATVVGWWLFA